MYGLLHYRWIEIDKTQALKKNKGIEIPMIIDSGASVNVLDGQNYKRLERLVSLAKSDIRIFPYGSTHPLPFGPVVSTVNAVKNSEVERIISEHKAPQRRVPFHVREAVDKKLQELEDLDIIESVIGPTPWVSPLVAVPKSNGEVRVCVDMRRVNEAVIRERHPIPTLEETLQSLNGAAVFSKLDLRWGYHQVELHPESRALTTFSTHNGLKRYKRLIFGLSSAPETYQYVMQSTLQGIVGVRNISDDIIVFGKTQEEHDRSLEQTLQRLQDSGLTLNKEKCVFSVSELVFFGFKVSAAGLSPDQKKIDAVKEARAPTNAAEVRSFLGLVNYCARFIPEFATMSEPLRQLTRKYAEWSWGQVEQDSFDKLKASLTSDCVMAHYDPAAETHLRVDASPVGLGAILLQCQDGVSRPVAYASRTLTDVERRYSQTEKEALAVVWGCEKFHLYLYGTEFTLFTDHKPLEVIYSPRAKPPARIERWVLRLQPYRFKICHMEGESLLVCVDACSRCPEVEILRSTTSEVIVSHLRKIFAVHGLPEQVTSDNGSNLVSATMEQYLEANGIKHRKVTPYWPQANAQVERFNRTVEKAIRTAHVEGKNWRMELYIFLLNYRATPHATTGVSPAKILFGREIRTKVPQLPSKETSEVLRAALQFDKERKQHMKEYADKKRGLTPSTIQEGDQVLLKLERDNKLTPAFDPDPYTVIERKGASVVLQREEGYTLMRNVSAVKKVYIQENLTESELDFDGLNQAADPEPVPAQEPCMHVIDCISGDWVWVNKVVGAIRRSRLPEFCSRSRSRLNFTSAPTVALDRIFRFAPTAALDWSSAPMHSRSRLEFCSHSRPRLEFYSHSRSRLEFCSHSRSRLEFCSHSRSRLEFCSHSRFRLEFCSHSRTRLEFCFHSRS
ncbi:hypothetical protein QZH41_005497 [Actinostola sp. cb2023]|nr:hypothetical protein QZH41_005497 [Actinostola sp. cb2023]